MEEHKVNYFQGLVHTGKAQGFKTCAHRLKKCKFYTERIALESSSKELHQIVNLHSNKHSPKILPNIFTCSEIPSNFHQTLYQQSRDT